MSGDSSFEETYDLPVSWVPQTDSMDPQLPDVAIRFSTGIVGYVYKDPKDPDADGDWIWKLIRSGEVIEQGWSYTRDQAQRAVEFEAPKFAISPSEP